MPDFSQDPNVQAAIQTAQSADDAANQQAESDLDQQLNTIQTNLQNAYDTADNTYDQTIADDAATYQTAQDQADQDYNNTLAANQATHDAAVASAQDAYDQASADADQTYTNATNQSAQDRQNADDAADQTYADAADAAQNADDQATQQANDAYDATQSQAVDDYNTAITNAQNSYNDAADATGVSGVYTGISGRDIATGQHLGLTDAQQRQMLTEGSIQVGSLVLPSVLKYGGRVFLRGRSPATPKAPTEPTMPGSEPVVPETATPPAKTSSGNNAGEVGAAEQATVQTACFVDGTPIRLSYGCKPIEQIQKGDRVLSRDQNNPSGPVVEQIVEETFIRLDPVIRLTVGGQELRPTGEHPFYVPGRGWVSKGTGKGSGLAFAASAGTSALVSFPARQERGGGTPGCSLNREASFPANLSMCLAGERPP